MMNFLTIYFRALRGLAMLLFVAFPAVAYAQTVTGVGFHEISIHDPVGGGMMPGYVFYPSTRAKGVTWIAPYELPASVDAIPVPGAKPLVVISHGHGGSDLDLHDLAVDLASHGFVVATLEHPKDNYRDSDGNGTAAVEIGRPIQVKATITMLLHEPRWKALIDSSRIGVAGFSSGGYTALTVVGAVPQFTRLVDHCKQHPEDLGICGTVTRVSGTAHETDSSYFNTLQKDLGKWGNIDDPRVKAAFVMAPFGLVFDKAGLAHIDRPVFLYYGQADQVLLPKYNVLHIAPLIRTLAGVRAIPKAGHFVFVSPCSPALTKRLPDICKDAPGVDRVAVHRQIDADALMFFRKVIGQATH
jgi:predicted dienelactone hydrolase